MIHPSYVELMNNVNKDCPADEPIVKSRYSIVTATARRARQLIDHADTDADDSGDRKPLSIAVQEINEGSVKILSDSSAARMREEMEQSLALAALDKDFEEAEASAEAEESDEENAAENEAVGEAADAEEASEE